MKSRYYRDQLSLLKKLMIDYGLEVLDDAMIYCSGNDLYSINDIKSAVEYMNQYNIDERGSWIEPNYQPLTNKAVMNVVTQKRGLQEYDLAGGNCHE